MNKINIDEPNVLDTSNITTKDLIYLYLRELDLLQKSIDVLECRLASDITRIEIDMRQHSVTNEDNFKELRDNCKTITSEINAIRELMSKLKDTIHTFELDQTTCDLTQTNRLNNLEIKVAFYSAITTVVSFFGMQGLIQLFDYIRTIF